MSNIAVEIEMAVGIHLRTRCAATIDRQARMSIYAVLHWTPHVLHWTPHISTHVALAIARFNPAGTAPEVTKNTRTRL